MCIRDRQHILGKDKMLYRAIKADKLSSIILYGPPGTGKTTIARVIANTTKAVFTQMNATVAGKKDMEQVVAAAKERRGICLLYTSSVYILPSIRREFAMKKRLSATNMFMRI